MKENRHPAGDVDAIGECVGASAESLARGGAVARERVLARHDVEVEVGKLARLFRLPLGTSPP